MIEKAELYGSISSVIEVARKSAYRAVNSAMVFAYWDIGRLIVEDEQNGLNRAEYGKAVLSELSRKLTAKYGRGFSEQSLRNYRQFYMIYPIRSSVRSELTWTHYRLLIRVNGDTARDYYLRESIAETWSVRALERQINSFYYERILASQEKKPVLAEMKENTVKLKEEITDIIKNPYILEFLNIPLPASFTERELEGVIIDNIQAFLLELGRGFAFVARQKHIRTETRDFYIDLVFYNYILKCFVLIDLKTSALDYQDIGQMDMYVKMYDDIHKVEGDNPSVGIILCSEKDETIVKYSVLSENRQLFASRYMLYLPSEADFIELIEREKLNYRMKKEE